MGTDQMVSGDCGTRVEPLQFELRHLFLMVNLSALYFALVRSTGMFIAALAFGPLVLAWLIIRLRVQGMLQGLLLGGLVAGAVIVFAASAFGPVPPGQIVMASLLYPPLGCAYGLTCVTHRQLRQGL